MTRSLLCTVVLVALSVAVIAGPAGAVPPANLANGVVPPVGDLYSDLGVAFWQWTWSMPFDKHPLTDTAGIRAGQSGNVWFIGGTHVPTFPSDAEMLGQAERWGKVPQGTYLFFPIMNAEASTVEGNGATADELTACVQCMASYIDPEDLFCEVDGYRVKGIGAYEALSGPAIWGPLPANSVLLNQGYGNAVKGVTSLFMSDGYYILLAPMSPGEHTIHFGGHALFMCGMTFTLDITYHLTVG